MTILEISFIILFGILVLGFTAFALTSLHENQKRASRLAGLGSLGSLALCIILIFLPIAVQVGVALTSVVFVSGLLIWFSWPVQQQVPESPPPNAQVDERTIMFARARMKPGSHEFNTYYQAYPDTLLYNLIRYGVTHSANFRKAAVKMDDVFYGSKPNPHSPPEWIDLFQYLLPTGFSQTHYELIRLQQHFDHPMFSRLLKSCQSV